jgi:hypothetical protein
MQYNTFEFITSLIPEKHGIVTRLYDHISKAQFGYIIEIGPLTIMHINGWQGEEIRAVKWFSREWQW